MRWEADPRDSTAFVADTPETGERFPGTFSACAIHRFEVIKKAITTKRSYYLPLSSVLIALSKSSILGPVQGFGMNVVPEGSSCRRKTKATGAIAKRAELMMEPLAKKGFLVRSKLMERAMPENTAPEGDAFTAPTGNASPSLPSPQMIAETLW